MTESTCLNRVGKYEILEELGRGGFATAYRARDTILGREVALKILHPALLSDPGFVTRFENDARAAAQLHHPHIVTVYDMGQQDGRAYIAMQLLPGGTLAEWIRREGPLAFADAVRVLTEVAEALDYAHARGFVHRDVKPTNILFSERSEAVLTDFGLVKAVEGSVVARSSSGGAVGTPAYIAPEVWEGEEAGPGADVYAMSCVLYEMLTGGPMFRGETPPAVMLAHFKPLRFPPAWPEGVPADVQGVLERALAQDPAQRYPGAGAFAAALKAVAAEAADPLAKPYQALQAAMAAEDWPRAQKLAREVGAADPNYRDVSLLSRQVNEGLARANKAQATSRWKQQALSAEAEGQWEVARMAARHWLEIAPGDVEAAALLSRLAERARAAGLAPEPAAAQSDRQAAQPPALRDDLPAGRTGADIAGKVPAPASPPGRHRPNLRWVLHEAYGLLLGLCLGMTAFWYLWPVKWTDANTYDLSREAKATYVQLVASAARVDRDYIRASKLLESWNIEEKQQAFADAVQDYLDRGQSDKVQDVRDLRLILGVPTAALPAPEPPTGLTDLWGLLPLIGFPLATVAVGLALLLSHLKARKRQPGMR